MTKATNKSEKKVIDATGRPVGRLATEVATILQGKHRADYAAHLEGSASIEVRNASKMVVTGRKMEDKTYYHYSGYPGGMKERPLKDVMAKNPGEVLRRAVKNMLPKNRLQQPRLKRLKVYND